MILNCSSTVETGEMRERMRYHKLGVWHPRDRWEKKQIRESRKKFVLFCLFSFCNCCGCVTLMRRNDHQDKTSGKILANA